MVERGVACKHLSCLQTFIKLMVALGNYCRLPRSRWGIGLSYLLPSSADNCIVLEHVVVCCYWRGCGSRGAGLS
jgi:hypothetical protein